MSSATDNLVITGYRAGTWKADPSQSTIDFVIRQLVGKVRGRFTNYDITIVTGDTPLESSVTATIDLSSIDTGNVKRDDHLRGPQILRVEEHRAMSYRSVALQGVDEGLAVSGVLTLHGIAQPVPLELEVVGFGTDPSGIDMASFRATAQISRRAFGVAIPMEGGGVVVADKVTVRAEIRALLQV